MSGSGISWAVCKSAPCSWQIAMPAPHHSVFYRPDALPAAQPTASKHWRQNFDIHEVIMNIFGRIVSEKVSNEKMLYSKLSMLSFLKDSVWLEWRVWQLCVGVNRAATGTVKRRPAVWPWHGWWWSAVDQQTETQLPAGGGCCCCSADRKTAAEQWRCAQLSCVHVTAVSRLPAVSTHPPLPLSFQQPPCPNRRRLFIIYSMAASPFHSLAPFPLFSALSKTTVYSTHPDFFEGEFPSLSVRSLLPFPVEEGPFPFPPSPYK